MAPPNPVQEKRKFFSVEEANRTLPLVKQIVSDVVRQWEKVRELEQRLSVVTRRNARQRSGDVYDEEVAQSEAEMDEEKEKLGSYVKELEDLGVELKGPDGLCDFPSLMDGREVCLCWRLGEPEVAYWHEVRAGFAGRKPLAAATSNARRGDDSSR